MFFNFFEKIVVCSDIKFLMVYFILFYREPPFFLVQNFNVTFSFSFFKFSPMIYFLKKKKKAKNIRWSMKFFNRIFYEKAEYHLMLISLITPFRKTKVFEFKFKVKYVWSFSKFRRSIKWPLYFSVKEWYNLESSLPWKSYVHFDIRFPILHWIEVAQSWIKFRKMYAMSCIVMYYNKIRRITKFETENEGKYNNFLMHGNTNLQISFRDLKLKNNDIYIFLIGNFSSSFILKIQKIKKENYERKRT